MTCALILAGGLGQRMNQEGEPPKQFFKLGEKPVIIHTLERFERHPEIDAVCVVCLPTWEEYLHDLVEHFRLKKVTMIVQGGDVRQASVFAGLCELEKYFSPEDIVMVHDGVRPFITKRIISENIRVTRECGNAMTSLQSTDTLVASSNGGVWSEQAYVRDHTFAVQTPQTYTLGFGLEMYRKAYSEGRIKTINCCELFIEMGEKVYIVEGRKSNIKLTTQDDIAYLKFLQTIFSENDGYDDDE
jgi:2-C-methyl-D-erythritol 4-phosphate cytidylyltransferase